MTTYKTTNRPGCDYSMGDGSNRNSETGLRFGVISMHDVSDSWYEDSEPDYSGQEITIICPECGEEHVVSTDAKDFDCKCGEPLSVSDSSDWDFIESNGQILDTDEYKAQSCMDNTEILVMESPYFTYAQFCSPCIPGGCSLSDPLDKDHLFTDNRAYCFGHDWFEDDEAPYPVYSVKTGLRVQPNKE